MYRINNGCIDLTMDAYISDILVYLYFFVPVLNAFLGYGVGSWKKDISGYNLRVS